VTFKKRLTLPGFYILLAASLAFFAYTRSVGGTIGFLLIFGVPYFCMRDLPAYARTGERLWEYTFLAMCTLIFIFLITPILVIMPLSFNAEPYFTFTDGMLGFDADAYSLRWYKDIFKFGMTAPNASGSGWWTDMWNNSVWIGAFRNSFFIAIAATLLATALGTLAALGLSRPEMPFRTAITSLLISPMIVPLVITATGMFFFYAKKNIFPFYPDGLVNTYPGLILAHATLGVPFVIITVTATLTGFDQSLIRAAQGLGASSFTTFRRVIMPLILPGMISGALFAFITSLDEVVVVIFLADVDQTTIPRQMFSGIREQISPTILAVATVLVVFSIILLTTIELLRRRTERLRGLSPG
jgi:putative spermidine/putrescine transport system permease protein